MSVLGYEYLRESMGLSAFAPPHPARRDPSTNRIRQEQDHIAVPTSVSPKGGDPLDHVLFALKHEGTHLQILAEAMPRIDPASLVERLKRAPTGAYIRTACYLWERFTGRELSDLPEISGPTALLFDPERYHVVDGRRDGKWRVAFNGLGSFAFSPVVRRTEKIGEAIRADVLGRANDFVHSLDKGLSDRALEWAYLSETRGSFAIENENPDDSKAQRFVDLLRQAHDRRPLSEEYLVDLQNATVSNPWDQASEFRHTQNYLARDTRDHRVVTYVPPAPALARELMGGLMDFANVSQDLDPLLKAMVTSFGFVFIHPFMDGNGRLSRFLVHHGLCRSGRLQDGLLLPVSVAIHREEARYLDVLNAFSRKARALWQVRRIDAEEYGFEYRGPDSIYRYWDATACVEFGYEMAEQALQTELIQESLFLMQYDRLLRLANDAFDARGPVLSQLVRGCLQNRGRVSNNARKRTAHQVPEALYAFLEAHAAIILTQDTGELSGHAGKARGEPAPR